MFKFLKAKFFTIKNNFIKILQNLKNLLKLLIL